MFDDNDMEDEIDNLLREMVNDGYLEQSIDEEGEFVFSKTEKGELAYANTINADIKEEYLMSAIPLKVCLEEGAKFSRNNESDVGWDLFPLEDFVVEPQQRKLIKTGIKMEIPYGYVGLIKPRSGLALKKGIMVMAGVVDPGYRGDIGVILYNSSDEPFSVQSGEIAIAQMLFIFTQNIEPLIVDSLEDSDRGELGFGSSDKKE